MKILFIKSHIHHKNLHFILNCSKINFYIVENIHCINRLNLSMFDCVFSPCDPIDVSKYPNTKFIFGPQFSVFPTENLLQIKGKNSVYNLLSEWVVNIWKQSNLTNHLNLVTLPFGVDTNKFISILPIERRENVLVYFKHRNPTHLVFIEKFLKISGIKYEVYSYDKKYDEIDYLRFLQNTKYGIWIDAHESQGFALQEALSCDVPLLVWNVTSMSDEYGSKYDNSLLATTIPYWDNKCGEYFYNDNEFINKYNLFMSKLNTYKPREYILENLSIEVCENKLIDKINNIKI